MISSRLLWVSLACVITSGRVSTASAKGSGESHSLRIDLAKLAISAEAPGPIALTSLIGLHRFQIACLRRLLPHQERIGRCVDQSLPKTGDEIQDRVELVIDKDGKLRRLSVRQSKRLQGCLLAFLRSLALPTFSGKDEHTLDFLIGRAEATDGASTARSANTNRTLFKGKPYILRSKSDRQRYSQAVFWGFSPWSMAMGLCAEMIDATLVQGYRVRFSIELSPAGRATSFGLEVLGKMAPKALSLIAQCVAPFFKALQVPPHQGPKSFSFHHGSVTSRWEDN